MPTYDVRHKSEDEDRRSEGSTDTNPSKKSTEIQHSETDCLAASEANYCLNQTANHIDYTRGYETGLPTKATCSHKSAS